MHKNGRDDNKCAVIKNIFYSTPVSTEVGLMK